MTSPSTASSRGVAATIASRRMSIMPRSPEGQDRQDDDRLPERGDRGRDVAGALQLARPGGQRAEEERGSDGGQRMKLREKSDGDSGVAVAGSEALEQPVRHT